MNDQTASGAAYPAAELDRRFYAYTLDRVVVWSLYAVAVVVAVRSFFAEGNTVLGVLVIVAMVVVVALIQALLLGTRGTSPGKALVGLRVVDHDTGAPIGVPAALLRGLILGVAALPTVGLGVATLAWTAVMDAGGWRRGWHDHRTGAVVVDVRPAPVVENLDAGRPRQMVNLTAMRLMSPAQAAAAAGLPTGVAASRGPQTIGTSASTPSPPSGREVGQSPPQAPPKAPAGPPPNQPPPSQQLPSQPLRDQPPTDRPVGPPPTQPPSTQPPPTQPPPTQPPPTQPAPGAHAGPPASSSLAPAAPSSDEPEATRRREPRAPANAGPPSVTWRVSFDTGEEFVVEGLALVGRRPEARPGETVRHAVPLRSADMSISKTHAQFQVTPDGALVVMDRGSTNGSVILRQGISKPLTAGRPATLVDGDIVRFGDRSMTVAKG